MAYEMEFIARERRKALRSSKENDLAEEPPWLRPDGSIDKDTSQVELKERELRRARTRMAVLHVGGATLSSAMSTMGSSMFLLFCTLNIFVKLGAVVIAVTLLSIVFALVPL